VSHSRLQILIAACLLALAVIVRVWDPAPVAKLRLSIFDQYLDLAPRVADPSYPVRIVDIDEASLQSLGQWPWPRTRLAEIVSRLNAAGVKAIAFDLILAEADRLSPEAMAATLSGNAPFAELADKLKGAKSNDAVLAEAIGPAPVVLGFSGEIRSSEQPPKPRAGFAFGGDDPALFAPAFPGAVNTLPVLSAKASGMGAVNWLPERDQVVRRIPLLLTVGGIIQPSLSLEALRVGSRASTILIKASGASGLASFGQQTGIELIRVADAVLPTDGSGQMWLRLTRHDPKRYIPAAKVLGPTFDPDEVKDRFVFIGASAAGLLDLRATPLETAVPGVEVHAQALEQMLAGDHLVRPAYATGAELAFMVLAGAVLFWLIRKAGPVRAALVGVGAILAVIALSWQAYAHVGLLFDPIYPALSLLVLYVATSLVTYIITETERSRVRSAFGHYIPPAIVDGIVADPARLKLGGETREVTVLFADVRGFSRISEGLSAEQLIDFVNTLFSPLTDIIYEEGGTVDKYMGDAVMAFWNAPLDVPDHALRASRAALRMQAELKRINDVLAREAIDRGAKPVEARLGIGLNTGACVVGNVGSEKRKNYSILGDVVNVAARLEEATKTYGVPIIMGERTAAAAQSLAIVEIDRVPPRGKDKPERLFTLLGDEAKSADPAFTALRDAFSKLAPAIASRDAASARTIVEYVRKSGWPGIDALLDALLKRAGA
jgi:adenylate cyclase